VLSFTYRCACRLRTASLEEIFEINHADQSVKPNRKQPVVTKGASGRPDARKLRVYDAVSRCSASNDSSLSVVGD
jgi:hypothetical protein